MKNYSAIAILVILTLAGLVLTGCDESVDPVLGTDERFTLYGFLNPRADTQAVRVFSIDGLLEATRREPLDARFLAEEVSTGRTFTWRDSVVTFLDGSLGHVFYSAFTPNHDARYKITVESPDGVQTEVGTRTPPSAAPELESIHSSNRNVRIRVEWHGAPRLLETVVIYNVQTEHAVFDSVFVDRQARLRTGELFQNDTGGWSVEFRPSRDIGALFSFLNLRPGIDKLFLRDIEVQAFVANQNWKSPTGSFDVDLLVQPGIFSNVLNGFGFVGGGYFDSFSYEPTDDVRENAGFNIR